MLLFKLNMLKATKYLLNSINVRHYCSKKLLRDYDITKLRNIGILAHIDAGKTTTTERMLYYSGTISQMGEVHHGNTVTDYMTQERDRGITIRSAAVTFPWKQHQFNLIDTPGHIDFTMEVEQTLNILDGAIVILDASAGVEAQTLTVWRQADRYNIPRIIFVNKMDRQDADLNMCCKSVEEKLDAKALPLHIPFKESGKLTGIIDVLTQEKLTWNQKGIQKTLLTEQNDGSTWEQTMQARSNVIDTISEWNDKLATIIIESESTENIKLPDIIRAIKIGTQQQKAVPVLCGSAYKNIGVQPLMDAVILYLPSPDECTREFKYFEDNLCARAFKVLHDKQRGPLVFLRIYSGQFSKGQRIYNVQQDLAEQSQRLLIAYADDFEEVDVMNNGNIAVVTGLKKTITGDLITTSTTAAQKTKKKMEASKIDPNKIESLFSLGARIPEPVFFCSIEPPSLAYQTALDQALIELEREDPSLRVSHDAESGQTILAGMGELHLEIIKDRILKEYKVDAELGPLQISYRESPLSKIDGDFKLETKIGNSKQSAYIKLSIRPTENIAEKDLFKIDKSQDADESLGHILPKHLAAIKQGITVGLCHGPKLGCSVTNTQVMLRAILIGRGTSESIIAATATQCVNKLLNEAGTSILEPMMYLEIVTPDEYLSAVMADLNKRRAVIENVTMRGKNKMVLCETPLSEMMGYSTILRTLTSGTGTFSMEFLEYRKMSSMDETRAIESVRGF